MKTNEPKQIESECNQAKLRFFEDCINNSWGERFLFSAVVATIFPSYILPSTLSYQVLIGRSLTTTLEFTYHVLCLASPRIV